ncbi:MAG: low specificity L-threonine aldolase [Verrucomicrobiales bacterium]|nr:low specificity L-threonine aldolase [Verrucomicrobiales bacterium]
MTDSSPRRPRHFASDNNSGICPEALNAVLTANSGHITGYGDDPWTTQACRLIRDLLETDAQVFFVFNGTAANALSLSAACRPYHAVLCHEFAHIQHDECGAPEFFSGGAKLLPLPGDHGKLRPEVIAKTATSHFPLHSSKPAALSLTQATECGTVYTPAELSELSETAHAHGLRVHLDGARLANAVASLGVPPKDITWRAGIDILSLGATKNGGLFGEAIVVFDRELGRELDYRIKQSGQLASKMRFLAAPWIGLLADGAWLRYATHANTMARRLSERLSRLPGTRLLHPTEANGVFVELPGPAIRALHARGWHFYVFEGETGCRLMCSWDTTEDDLNAFVADLQSLLPEGRGVGEVGSG